MSAALIDLFARLVEAQKEMWISLGNVETKQLSKKLIPIEIDRPIYITGLARSGTTILLEALSHHPDLASHTYRDFPLLYTPYVWHWLLDRFAGKTEIAQERAHRDRILVTSRSPEAMEEILWMAFFSTLHEPGTSSLLDERLRNRRFEAFYPDHLKKLLLYHGKPRYLAKANYQLTRIPYLLRLFPEARFLILVRDPVSHIASLVKQDRLFLAEQTADPKKLRHSRLSGHYEFGVDFRPIDPGNPAAVARILGLRQSGETVRAWAAYWALLYGYVQEKLLAEPRYRGNVRVLRYEDICDGAATVLPSILDFCGLPDDGWAAAESGRFSQPSYYAPNFTDAERRAIAEETAGMAAKYGY